MKVKALYVALALVGWAFGSGEAVATAGLQHSSSPVDYIVVEKSNRVMTLWSGGNVVKSYRVALGRNPVGPKTLEGDGKTPEGLYFINGRNPNSEYHLSLHISYPNFIDEVRANQYGGSPGGAIVIHGLPEDGKWAGETHRYFDWTEGCIAVTNNEIEEIWSLVPDGTLIEIRP